MEKSNYVVIGSSTGIGWTIVTLLAEGDHSVYVGSRSAAPVEFEAGITPFTWEVFLLGNNSSWISGQVFHVDGGMSSLRTFS